MSLLASPPAPLPSRPSPAVHRIWGVALPAYVDGGAHIMEVARYRLADRDGPLSAIVLADWGDPPPGRGQPGAMWSQILDRFRPREFTWPGADNDLPRWGTHVMTYEPDWRRFLLFEAHYFSDLHAACRDLHHRRP